VDENIFFSKGTSFSSVWTSLRHSSKGGAGNSANNFPFEVLAPVVLITFSLLKTDLLSTFERFHHYFVPVSVDGDIQMPAVH
jgi:hypothetical protein